MFLDQHWWVSFHPCQWFKGSRLNLSSTVTARNDTDLAKLQRIRTFRGTLVLIRNHATASSSQMSNPKVTEVYRKVPRFPNTGRSTKSDTFKNWINQWIFNLSLSNLVRIYKQLLRKRIHQKLLISVQYWLFNDKNIGNLN